MKNSQLAIYWLLFLLIQVWTLAYQYVWWVAWCVVCLVVGASSCKKKTICRPPPGGRPGCGGGRR